jgi:adenylate cyclase
MTAIRLETFLFADLVGFSAFTEREGDDAAADVAVRFASGAASLAAEHGARLVKCLGDAVMIHAPNASEGIELGLRLNSELAGCDGMPEVHAGAHTGAAVKRGADWFGTAVNVAARVVEAACGGELLVTEPTAVGAGPISGVCLQPRETQTFKNIGRAIPIFAASRSAPC